MTSIFTIEPRQDYDRLFLLGLYMLQMMGLYMLQIKNVNKIKDVVKELRVKA